MELLTGEQRKDASPEEVRQTQDFVVLRLVALGLTAVALTAAIGVMVLAAFEQEIPEGVLAFGSAAVGALATMMTRSIK